MSTEANIAVPSPWNAFCIRAASAMGYRRLTLLAAPLNEDVRRVEADASGNVTVRELTPDLQPVYHALRPDTAARVVERRLASGDACLTAWVADCLASAMWFSRDAARIAFLQVEMSLGPGEIYLFDSFTSPAFRGRGLAPLLSAHILESRRRDGDLLALRGTFPANTPALRAHAKNGFRPVGTVGSLTLGPLQWRFLRAEEPRPLRRWKP